MRVFNKDGTDEMPDLPNTAQVEGHAIRCGTMGESLPLVAIHGTPFSSQVRRRIIQGRELAKPICGGRLTEIAGSGPLVQEDQPDAIAAALVKHVGTV